MSMNPHERPEPILRYFEYNQLTGLQTVAKAFRDIAHELVDRLPPSQERYEALRRLLDAKNAAQRAAMPDAVPTPYGG